MEIRTKSANISALKKLDFIPKNTENKPPRSVCCHPQRNDFLLSDIAALQLFLQPAVLCWHQKLWHQADQIPDGLPADNAV